MGSQSHAHLCVRLLQLAPFDRPAYVVPRILHTYFNQVLAYPQPDQRRRQHASGNQEDPVPPSPNALPRG